MKQLTLLAGLFALAASLPPHSRPARQSAYFRVRQDQGVWWLIAPDFHRNGISLSWLDVLLPLSMGAIWLACFVWQLRGRAILPIHDPEFDETLGDIIERGAEQPRTAH